MLSFFKRFRKGRLSKDAISALFPICAGRKASVVQETSIQHHSEKVKEQPCKHAVLVTAFMQEGEPVMIQPPEEPCEIDHPIRCPHPEPCIIQDGQALKERPPRVKRRGQLPFLTKSEVRRLHWSCYSAPSDYRTYLAATGLEPSSLTQQDTQ